MSIDRSGCRISILAAAILAFAACVPVASAHEFGFIGGANLANLGGDAEEFGNQLALVIQDEIGGLWTANKKSFTGLDVGMFYGAELNPDFMVQTELHYVQRGCSYELAGTDGLQTIFVKEKLNLNYVEVPLLAHLSFNAHDPVRPVIVFGPMVGFRVSSSAEASAAGFSESTDISDGMKSAYLGAVAGAGLSIDVSRTGALLVQARYVAGLTNLIDDPSLTLSVRDVSILVGLSVGLDR